MNRFVLKKALHFLCILIFGLWATRCATTTPQTELKTYPLTEINLENVFRENRGLKVVPENATMIHDFYRGGVQEKEEGKNRIGRGEWEEARRCLETSNRYLRVVIKYLPEDEAQRNVYGDEMLIFMPNLLIADNDLSLITVYRRLGEENKAAEARSDGLNYLAQSLKAVKTEWAYQLQNRYEDESPKK